MLDQELQAEILVYMDEADQLFYMLFLIQVLLKYFYFSKINEAGTVTAIGKGHQGGWQY